MISTVAFACVSPDRLPVRRIEFTPELEASLGLSRLGALTQASLFDSVVEEGESSSEGVQQHLYLVHTTTSRIQLPPLALERTISFGGICDLAIGFDCLGVCYYELDWPGDDLAPSDDNDEANTAAGADNGSDVVHDTVPANKVAKGKRRAVRGHATPRFVEQFHDFLRDNGALDSESILKIVSKYKVRAVLLVEPPEHGGESRMRLYADSVGNDEI